MLTDCELIEKCLDGNQDCFTELVTRYKKLIYNIVYTIIKNRDEADDISQEVFIRIYKSLGSYKSDYKFSTWSARIARNLCLDELRKKKVNYISIDEFDGFAKDSDTPEKRYINFEYKQEIQNIIDELPGKYKSLIVLYHKKGMSYKEMSQILNEPMSIIKNRLFRARMLLKQRLIGVGIA